MEKENEFRKDNRYPPFSDICVLMYKNEIEQKLYNQIDKLYKEILFLQKKYGLDDIEIYATPPLVYKVFGKYRYNIVMKGQQVRNFMDIIFTKLEITKR